MKNDIMVIAFPRSGNHFISACIEAYFGRKRKNESFFSFFDYFKDGKSEYIFNGSHDFFSKEDIDFSKTIYLYRNPEDVIFSNYLLNSKLGKLNQKSFNVNFSIDNYCVYLKNQYKKYLLNDKVLAKVRYENFVFDFEEEFKKIIKAFDDVINLNRIDLVKNNLTKSNMISYIDKERVKLKMSGEDVYMGTHLLADTYENERKRFLGQYKNQIRNKTITKEIKEYF